MPVPASNAHLGLDGVPLRDPLQRPLGLLLTPRPHLALQARDCRQRRRRIVSNRARDSRSAVRVSQGQGGALTLAARVAHH